jgi:WD40 repeat protein
VKRVKSCGTVPLFSPLLFRLAVWRASRRAVAGDMPAVRELADVFCTSPDPRARDLARRGLTDLKSADQIDLLCRESLLRGNDALTGLARDRRYLPSAPAEQALWLFCSGRKGELHSPGTEEDSPLLAAGYRGASAAARARARYAARMNGSCALLSRALTRPGVTHHAGDWSYDEWDVVINGLTGTGQWDDLWLLVPLAPLPLAVKAMQALKTAGWLPRGDACILWEELARDLPDRWTYPLPAGQPREPAGRPAGQVTRLCFSPDGSLFATGSCDGMVTVWRTASAGPALEFSAGQGSVRFLAIPPGNTFLVSAADDGTIRCHSLKDRALVWLREGRGAGTALALTPDGSTVLAGDERGNLDVLDIHDGRALYTIPLGSPPVTCLAPAPAGPAVACGHTDGTVTIVRPGEGLRPLVLPGNSSPVSTLSWRPSGTECLAVYEQGHPVLWDITGGIKRCTFTTHAGRAICTAVPSAGGWFAAGCDDHTLRCWDLSAGTLTATVPFYSRHITSCSAAPDGSILAAGFHDGSIRIYRMPAGDLVREFKGHKKTVTSCMLAPDGTRLATVSWDGTTRLWRVPGGEIVRTIDAHAGGIAALAGPAGTLVAAVTEDGIARVIDAADGKTVRTLDLYTPSVRAAAMSPDGTYLAITGADSSLRIWDIRNGSLAAAGDRLPTSQRCCTFLPDSSMLVSGGWDGTCRFFRIMDAVPLRALAGHTSIVTCCTVSRDGTLLVTGSNDTTVRLWRTAEEEAYAVLRDSRSEVGAVALSPDATLLAAGNRDGIIRIYHLPYGDPGPGLPDLPGKVTALAFTADGCVLAAGYDTGTCALFSMPERSLIRTIPTHNGAVTGLAILPDGRTLVTTGADGLCRFHALPCTQFPVHASIADIPAPVPGGERPVQGPGPDPAVFHRALLAARFLGEIGICPPMDTVGCYDIQIVG